MAGSPGPAFWKVGEILKVKSLDGGGGSWGSEVGGNLLFSLCSSVFLPCTSNNNSLKLCKKRLMKNINTISLEAGNRPWRNRLSENKILSQCL